MKRWSWYLAAAIAVSVLAVPAVAGAARTPTMSRADAKMITRNTIIGRLGYSESDARVLIRTIECKRRSRVRFFCVWLAGGDTHAREGRGTVGWAGLDRRGNPRLHYVFVGEVRRIIYTDPPTTRVVRRFAWRLDMRRR